MKENRLTIKIDKPVHEVFAYTITPPNTKFWVDSIIDEKTSEWPVRVGTVYKEQTKSGDWSNYIVTDFSEGRIFELKSEDNSYHVRYIYKPATDNVCELEYYEWVDEGDLKYPFTLDILSKLKRMLEE